MNASQSTKETETVSISPEGPQAVNSRMQWVSLAVAGLAIVAITLALIALGGRGRNGDNRPLPRRNSNTTARPVPILKTLPYR